MSEYKRVLVLHLTGGGEPLLLAVADDAEELAGRLPDLIRTGDIETVTAANGTSLAINFAHVVAAQVDTVPGLGQIYGSPRRER